MQSRDEFFKRAKKKVTIAVSSRDNLLIQSVSAVDELNKSSNLLFERLTEWYGTASSRFLGMGLPDLMQITQVVSVFFILKAISQNAHMVDYLAIFLIKVLYGRN